MFVVLLRIAIGWQLLYEGLWKVEQLDTSQPWSAEGYLRNAQGPFRDYFRSMTGDPDDLNRLDYDWMSRRWDHWRDQFIQFYGLDEDQQKALRILLDGPSQIGERVAGVPAGVTLPPVVTFDAERNLLIAEGDVPLKDAEVDEVRTAIAAIDTPESQAFRKAFEDLARKSQELSYRRRLRAIMLGDPERVGATAFQREGTTSYVPEMGTVVTPDGDAALLKYGDVQRYKDMLDRYEQELSQASTDSEFDHLAREWQQIQQLRVKLVGPVTSLEKQLFTDAWKLLSADQLARGRLEHDESPIHGVNRMTMWGLLILGFLLIIGLMTPLAAVMAAVMIFMFYLPIPPWPGVPQPPGPEHSFIVNKNLIESIALLGIAALPTGRWFGLDAVIARLFRSRRGTST